MPTADELRAALAVAELEEDLIEAKATPEGPSRELKEQVREARREHREIREAARVAALPSEQREALTEAARRVSDLEGQRRKALKALNEIRWVG